MFPAASWLRLPPDIQFQVEDAINQLESGDFRSYSEDFYDLPREFTILGSCLFHRGMLVASHLPRDDMVDVALWIKFRKQLRLTSRLPFRRIVAWSEVHLTRHSFRAESQDAAALKARHGVSSLNCVPFLTLCV